MQSKFQRAAHEAFAELAKGNQLDPYPLVESGNGVEYKNFLNDTVFTVYHDRLDAENDEFIELAIGAKNIAAECSLPIEIVESWLSEIQAATHPAKSKSPQWWPRLSVWSIEEVQLFCKSYEALADTTTQQPSRPGNSAPQRKEVPPIDERVSRDILTRRGQAEFRAALLSAYGGRCAISGCPDPEVLEAAHIIPHGEVQDYSPTNGLLLRTDLHTLFDLRLLSIKPETGKVVVAGHLSSTYQSLSGMTMTFPASPAEYPNASALKQHFLHWKAREENGG